ncbi:MAG: hypothetical protein AAF805_07815 [Planctomycetota bacterium]
MADGDATGASEPPIDTAVVLIDGLRANALGAYGQTAYETPAFDRLAAAGVVGSECYAATPDSTETLNAVAAALTRPATLLVSDEAAVSGGSLRAGADWVDLSSPTRPEAPASSVGETDQARVWTGFAEHLAPRLAEADRGAPLLAVCHTRGLYGAWDAPPALIEDLVSEDDPAADVAVDPPDETFDPPHSAEACDARFAASVRYAAMVRVIDACLEGWLAAMESAAGERPTRVVVAGLRGFPLGEHGRVGGFDARLFAEQQHAPLLWQDAGGHERFARRREPADLAAAIAAAALGRSWPATDRLRLRSSEGWRALLTEDRALLAPPSVSETDGVSLFVRPDDCWQQNDIASLEPARCEAMLAELASPPMSADSGVAAPGASK